MSYKNSCYVNGSYPLLLFLLINSKNNLDDTFFFLGRGVPENIAKNIKNSWHLNAYFKKKNKLIKYFEIYSLFKKLEKFIEKEKLKEKEMYLLDSVSYSQFFLNHIDKCYLLEDGLENYNVNFLELADREQPKLKRIKNIRDRFLKRTKINYKILGLSDKIQKIYLTGLTTIPSKIKDKVEIVKIKEIWDNLSFSKKEEILKIFNFDIEKLEKIKKLENKILIITQPLSEDNILTEEEKIELYREMIKNYSEKDIVIKRHPREKTNYKISFPEAEIIEEKFPLEILSFLGIRFKEVITMFSTAAYNFKGLSTVRIIGTENNIKLKKVFGVFKSCYYKI